MRPGHGIALQPWRRNAGRAVRRPYQALTARSSGRVIGVISQRFVERPSTVSASEKHGR